MDQQSEFRRQFNNYVIGLIAAVVLTCAAFATVKYDLASLSATLIIIFVLAVIQVGVHFRFFLHITLARAARDDLQLILFSTLITLMMAGGTLVILFNLYSRM